MTWLIQSIIAFKTRSDHLLSTYVALYLIVSLRFEQFIWLEIQLYTDNFMRNYLKTFSFTGFKKLQHCCYV